MNTLNELMVKIENSDAETMYYNFRKIVEEYKDLEEIDEDMDHFIEDEDDDRRKVSIGIFKHIPSETTIKATTRINNDPCGNFNVMNFSIVEVEKKRKQLLYMNNISNTLKECFRNIFL